MPEVSVLGSANVDLVTCVNRFPLNGETVHGISFSQHFGGKGANVAAMIALLSDSPGYVSMCAMLGSDSLGASTRANFEGLGVDMTNVLVYIGSRKDAQGP